MIKAAVTLRLQAILLLVCALAAPAYADDIDALFATLSGSYRTDTTDPNAGVGGAPADLTAHYAVVSAPAIGERVVYWQLDQGQGPDSQQRIYRQTLLVFDPAEDGGFSQRAYNFTDRERFKNGHLRPGIFANVQADDLVAAVPDDCLTTWTRTAAGWGGVMAAASCRIYSERAGMWRLIGVETLPRADRLLYVERGFSEDGELLFGLPEGEQYRFNRISD